MTTSEMNQRVCTAMRAYMDDHGVNQADISRHLGRSESYVSARMNGKLELSLDIMSAVAEMTRVSPYALMAELTTRMGPSA